MRAVCFGVMAALGLGGAAWAQPAGFDGTYVGPRTVVRDTTHARGLPCPLTHETTVVVKGGVFAWNYTLKEPQPVTVKADGSFGGQVGPSVLSGRIAGGHFIADAGGEYCGFHFDLTKK